MPAVIAGEQCVGHCRLPAPSVADHTERIEIGVHVKSRGAKECDDRSCGLRRHVDQRFLALARRRRSTQTPALEQAEIASSDSTTDKAATRCCQR
jgi:hypothetical protein